MILPKISAVMCPLTQRLMKSVACQSCIYVDDYNEREVICKYDEGD